MIARHRLVIVRGSMVQRSSVLQARCGVGKVTIVLAHVCPGFLSTQMAVWPRRRRGCGR
jgi:hypothetical protein